MTALCVGGGTSSPQPSVQEHLVYATGLAGLISPAPGFEWLIPILPFLGVIAFDTPSICATDPPAVPSIGVQDVANIFTPFVSPDAAAASRAKFYDLIKIVIWPSLCKCDAGAQPGFPAPVAPPANIPVLAPLSSTSALDLYTTQANSKALLGTPPANWFLPAFDDSAWTCVSMAREGSANTVELYNGSILLLAGSTVLPPQIDQIAPTFTAQVGGQTFSLRWTFNLTDVPTVEPKIDMYFNQLITGPSTAQVWINGTQILTAFNAASWFGKYKLLTTGKNVVAMEWATSNANSRVLYSAMRLNFGSTGTSQIPSDCCGQQAQLIASVLTGLQSIASDVRLIQRQAVPFGYVPGAVHAGVSGAGAIAISGILGIKVHATAFPTTLGQEGTSPTKYFDAGFLTFGTADGYPASYRLERQEQLLLPARCSAFTELAYDLAPGVTLTITELLREP